MIKKNLNKNFDESIQELYQALLLMKSTEDMGKFFKDLCTPQEIQIFAERWNVCKLLNQGNLSYREINALTGASLATIGRVARFLHTEPHHGYKLALTRMKDI